MGTVHELPGHRDWFGDGRGEGRRMQVTWHPEYGFVVFSLWRRDLVTSTFRLPIEDAPRLITLLANSLGNTVAQGAERSAAAPVPPPAAGAAG